MCKPLEPWAKAGLLGCFLLAASPALSAPPASTRDFVLPESIGGPEHDRRYHFSPDGSLLLFGLRFDSQVHLWDMKANKKLGTLNGNFRGNGWTCAFSPDGKILATADIDHYGASAVDLWSLPACTRLRNLDDDVNNVPFHCLAFSPDAKTLALGAGFSARARSVRFGVHLWKSDVGEEVRQISLEPPQADPLLAPRLSLQSVHGLAWSLDGRSLAVVSQNKVLLIELLTGKERTLLGTFPTLFSRNVPLAGSAIRHAAFAPNGRTLAVLPNDGVLRWWDVVQGQELTSLRCDSPLVAFHFSDEGRQLAGLTTAGKLVAWNLTDARPSSIPVVDLPAEELEALWARLGNGERLELMDAIERLAERPKQVLAWLQERVKPVPAIEARYVERLIQDLQGVDFNQRKRAAAELRRCGEQAIPVLLKSQEVGFDEVTRKFLDKLTAQGPAPEQLQQMHALQVLERMKSREARERIASLADGAPAAYLTREAKRMVEGWAPERGESTSATPESWWSDLGSADAERAYDAMRALTRQPSLAVTMLREKLIPIVRAAPDDRPEQIQRWLADLDAPEFSAREKASAQLGRLGKVAEPALFRALAKEPSLEQKNRLEKLLRQTANPHPNADQLHLERGLETLERIGGGDAERLVESLLEGTKCLALQTVLKHAQVRVQAESSTRQKP